MLRASCHPYTIVRPGWFDAGTGREQCIELRHRDHVDYGPVARAHVRGTFACARLTPEARGRTLELFAAESSPIADWVAAFDALAPAAHPPEACVSLSATTSISADGPSRHDVPHRRATDCATAVSQAYPLPEPA